MTIFMYACKYGCIDIVKYCIKQFVDNDNIIESIIDINQQSKSSKRSALQWALYNEHSDIVKLLGEKFLLHIDTSLVDEVSHHYICHISITIMYNSLSLSLSLSAS